MSTSHTHEAIEKTERDACFHVICIRIIVISFFLRPHLFVLAPVSETSEGVGTIRPTRSRCRRFGRDPCSVSRVASLYFLFALGMDKANSRVSATSPGIGYPHPLSPCTHVRIGCKPGFSAGGYRCISLFLHRAPRYDPAAQQQSSPLAAAACNSMRVWLLL